MSSGWKAGYGWADDHQGKAYSYSTPSSPTDMSFPAGARTVSPIIPPFRVNLQPDNYRSSRIPREPSTDIFAPSRVRKPSNSRLNDTLSEPSTRKGSVESYSSPTVTQFSPAHPDQELFSSRYAAPSSSSSHQKPARTPRPSTSDGTPQSGLKRSRGSLLVAASDVLAMKFRRRRPSLRQPPLPAQVPILLPDVIEISAPAPDKEAEEREQLKEMAAQSIGLGPAMMQHDLRTRGTPIDEHDEEEDAEENLELVSSPVEMHNARDSTLSISQSASAHTHGGRYRSGSMAAHSRTNSATLALVPSYPSTPAALKQFQQHASTLPKYYPPSSLRIFALSKNWKTRYMILSSPTAFPSRTSRPPVSYLHLFKSSNPDEKELERFEINEESVVFVAEEEVGGRRHVVKVAGADVGAMKKEFTCEEAGRTMWFLQITDSTEAQKWISAIKNAILGQRTMRAGLGPPFTYGSGVEPRGDMDVMLSMRAQGMISPSTGNGNRSQPSQADRAYASSNSSHSVRSQAATSRPPSTGPVSTLKGFFTGSGRPRASSRAASIDVDRQVVDRDSNDDPVGSLGSTSFGKLRPSSAASELRTPQTAVTSIQRPVSTTPTKSEEHRDILERKIVTDQHEALGPWATKDATEDSSDNVVDVSQDRPVRPLSMGAFALQPPPRKRWTSTSAAPIVTTIPSDDNRSSAMYSQMNGNASTAGIFGVGVTQEKPADDQQLKQPISPTLSGFSAGTPEQRSRTESVRSVSTMGSTENPLSAERSSPTTKKSSNTRRWSRQGTLPQRLTPPSGPPPPAPSQSNPSGRAQLHPYAAIERPPSRTSSQHSNHSQLSVVSNLPSFSKRASASSAFSVTSSSTSQSHQVSSTNQSITTRSSSHRSSMPPPPRPAPTFALPPAPSDQDHTSKSDNPTTNGKSFRERTFRLSVVSSKPPPASNLPPRSDENRPVYRHSMDDSRGPSSPRRLDPIPASSIPTSSIPPFPPPLRPLPPPPASPPASSPPHSPPPPSNRNSLKQRLRILSAPSSSPPNSTDFSVARVTESESQPKPLPVNRPRTSTSASLTAASLTSTSTAASPKSIPTPLPYPLPSPPATPIAEKITNYQDDPSFFEMHTPTIPSSTPPSALLIHSTSPTRSHFPFHSHSSHSTDNHRPPSPEHDSAFSTALSPPPRRGSRQLNMLEVERLSVLPEEKEKSGDSKDRTPSPPAAVIAELAGGGRHKYDTAFINMAPDEEYDGDDGDGELQESFTRPSTSASEKMVSLFRHGSVNSLGIVSM